MAKEVELRVSGGCLVNDWTGKLSLHRWRTNQTLSNLKDLWNIQETQGLQGLQAEHSGEAKNGHPIRQSSRRQWRRSASRGRKGPRSSSTA